jgi:hypothetical protein
MLLMKVRDEILKHIVVKIVILIYHRHKPIDKINLLGS